MLEVFLRNLIDEEAYVGDAPYDVDNCVWLRATSGTSDVYFNKQNVDKPRYSIYVRDIKNQEACALADKILNRVRNYTDATKTLIVTRLPSFVGRDERNRSVYTLQIELQVGG